MRILFLFSLLLSSFGFIQDSPYLYLKHEGKAVIYERVFEVQGSNKASIDSLIHARASNVRSLVDFNEKNDFFSGKIENALIDYKRYGVGFTIEGVFIKCPMTCNVRIETKDGKYRVKIDSFLFTSIADRNNIFYGDLLLTPNGKKWKQNATIIKSGKCLEEYLSDQFNFSKANGNW